jgi:hypothetical protein
MRVPVAIAGMSLLGLVALVVEPVVVAAPKQPPKAPTAPTAPKVGAKTPGACNTKLFPVAVGNEWTYTPVRAPFDVPDQIAKLAPPEPKKIVVSVKSVDKKGTDTEVTLSETTSIDLTKSTDKDAKPNLVDHTITTTIVCGKDKFDISPDSIYFAAEPGGIFGTTLDKIDRKGTSWKFTATGGIGETKWEEDLSIQWSRQATPDSHAKLTGGKLELERVFVPANPEGVVSTFDKWAAAEKVALTTTGRVTLENASPDAKPSELPAGWIAFLWFAPNVGVVQLLNPYGHMYQLTDAKLTN